MPTHNTQALIEKLNTFSTATILDLDDFHKSSMHLAELGADISIQSTEEDGLTLLHCLAMSNYNNQHQAAMEALLEREPTIIVCLDAKEQTPFGNLFTLNYAAHHFTFDDYKKTLLFLALQGNKLEHLQSLLSFLISNNDSNINEPEIRTLLTFKPELIQTKIYNTEGTTPLENTFDEERDCFEDSANLLIEFGADAHILLSRIKHYSFYPAQSIKWLLNHIDCTRLTETPLDILLLMLALAVHHQQYHVVKQLLSTHRLTQENIEEAQRMLMNTRNQTTNNLSLKLLDSHRLIRPLHNMRDYGQTLLAQHEPKGQIMIALADELEIMLHHYFENNTHFNQQKFDAFFAKFTEKLHSEDETLNTPRINWQTIQYNIAISLTLIGAVFLVGQLLYSKYSTGRMLFFGQKPTTACEDLVTTMQEKAQAFYLGG